MTRKEFEHIVPQVRPLLTKVGRDFFGTTEDAEDVAQEALLRLWQYAEQLDPRRNLEALAVRVAKNVCVDLYRRRVPQAPLPELQPAPPGDAPDAALHTREAMDRIHEAMDRLQPRERQLLEQRQLEGRTAEEIARETGIPKRSVLSMVAMAKKKLMNELKKRTQ